MRWSNILAAVGVIAGAIFAVSDEAPNLLAHCEAQSQDSYARMLILALLFCIHCLVLSAGAYVVLRLGRVGKGILQRIAGVVGVVAAAFAVGFCMAIADPVLHYFVVASCAAFDVCSGPGFANSLMRGTYAAANWPNTPVAVFMVTVFTTVAFVVQDIARREHNVPAQPGANQPAKLGP
ncbi:hypothetical protein [Dokdonella sp.]|uniref:hypothetical protein n=1 Tax=Dokdonella sp. TaxID=2291710 RepID=UPI0035273924